jgi:hypothetical protein
VLVVSPWLWFAVIAAAMINGLNCSAVSSMDQRHSWGTNSPWAGQEISFILWDTHVLRHFQMCPLPLPFSNQNSATHSLIYCSFSDTFLYPSRPGFPQTSFTGLDYKCISHLIPACYMSNNYMYFKMMCFKRFKLRTAHNETLYSLLLLLLNSLNSHSTLSHRLYNVPSPYKRERERERERERDGNIIAQIYVCKLFI